MYGVFYVEQGMYLKLCMVCETANEATAEAEWAEEHGEGSFVVKKI
jgi:hypothetical protein